MELGTVTPKPQLGNPRPRLFRDRTSRALINKMGFNNKGVDHLIINLKNRKTNIPIGVSIGKNFDTPNELAYQDYLSCLDKIYEFADYVAINISSPNTKGLRKLEAKKELHYLLSKIKQRQVDLSEDHGYVPLFLKISPDNSQDSLREICEVLKELAIDGLICSNTTTNHNFISRKGGLSGKPLMELSTQMLKLSREFLGEDIPIMASGGVMSSRDYKEKLESGANLVQIYTGFIYEGPRLIKDILKK